MGPLGLLKHALMLALSSDHDHWAIRLLNVGTSFHHRLLHASSYEHLVVTSYDI